jgi:hypothetical protein
VLCRLPGLLQRVDRRVTFPGHRIEARTELRQPSFEFVNGDIVLLYGQQRCNVWVHEPSK